MDFTNLTPAAVLGVVFCGVFSLLYGVHLATDVMAGPRFRRGLLAISQRPYATFCAGLFVAVVTQSSGATSSMLVALVNARVLPLTVAIIAMFGANIGSALAVQFLTLHITHFALPIMGIGTALALLTRKSSRRDIGQLCFSFGLMLFGLAALEVGGNVLAGNSTTALVLSTLSSSPLILALTGAVLTIIFSSSVAGIGLVIVLLSHGLLSVEAALALVLGANVGSTITALFSSLFGGSLAGRQLALLHTGTKFVLAVVFFSVLPACATALSWVPLPATTLVSLAHLSFNLAISLLFIPCIGFLANLAKRWLPDSSQETTTGPLYLHPQALLTPAEALGQATREVLHMTDLVTAMLNLGILAFEEKGETILARLALLDDQLDQLNADIKCYLTQLDEISLTEEQKRTRIALLYIITDLEAMGDLLETQCRRLAERKSRKHLIFSEEEWQEVIHYHQEIKLAIQQAFAAVATQDPYVSNAFFVRKEQLDRRRQELHMRHMQRLQVSVPLSVASNSLHLDLLTTFRCLLTYASTIAHVVPEYLATEKETNTYVQRFPPEREANHRERRFTTSLLENKDQPRRVALQHITQITKYPE